MLTFAPDFTNTCMVTGAFSSVGLEHLPYKQRVGGSNPSTPTLTILFFVSILSLLTVSCSTTKNIPDDDQLFIGLTKIEYKDYEKSENLSSIKAEVEAALATAPNGAFFGSSYYRTPFPYRLWVWNWADGSSGKIKKFMKKTIGKPPVLMSQVNPALHASVAQSVLRNNGYMHATVTYSEVPQRNPKKMKVRYTVRPDSLFIVDTVSYEHFPPQMKMLVDSTLNEANIKAASPFSVKGLDAERTRLTQLMRNQGYYYYQPSYASFLADTFDVRNRVHLRLQLADSLPSQALRPWYIGKVTMQMRRSYREKLTDSIERGFLTIRFNGKRPPIRPGVVLRNMKLRPRRLFNYDNYQESMQKVNATGVFSNVDFRFTPRPSPLTSHLSPLSDTLDLTLNCTFDKPYDFYVETNFVGRTIGRIGPELKIGVVRRNAFRGGEKLDINLHGSYEWQTSGGGSSTSTYQYGADASIEFPRTVLPFRRRQSPLNSPPSTLNGQRSMVNGPSPRRRRFYSTPWTIAKVSSDIIRRPKYYKMHIVSGEWTYRWQSSENSQHEFSPLTVKYQFMNTRTEAMDSLLINNLFLASTMEDRFIPKMRYKYTYTSHPSSHPSILSNPLRWETSIEESGNISSLYFLAKGEGWNTKNKKMFRNPYSQFLRLETDITKTWTLADLSQLVAHANVGVMVSYGNSDEAPFSEQFYVGGANSIRAFTVRSIGPGAFPGLTMGKQFEYATRYGDSRLQLNLEYRRKISGNLYGAVFLDAGNVWSSEDWTIDESEADNEEKLMVIKKWNELFSERSFKLSRFFHDLATGTGAGLRYDLDFLVVRMDWGFGLHLPYDTGKSGYFNIPRFKDMHSLHLAIGYPF